MQTAKEKKKNAQKKTAKKKIETELGELETQYVGNTMRLAKQLEELTGLESRVTILGHLQRGGTPSAADRLLATRLGTACAALINEGIYGVMVAARGDGTEPVPLEKVAGKRKTVPLDYRIEYDVEQAAAAIREHDLPEAFAQMVLQGRSLDAVLETSEVTKPETEEVVELETLETSDLEISEAAEETEVTDTSDSTVSEDDFRLKAVLELAENCEYEEVHTHQVTRLALLLFDELQPIHHFGAGERFWLQCGALLHDIGWIEGWKGHHKTALRTIRDTKLLPFDNQERLIIGSIARYHRRALPKKKHAHFAALKSYEREVVSVLAGILRVADGLDRTHQSLVENLSCEVNPDEIIVHCSVKHPSEEDRRAALKKGRLLAKVFNRKLVIELETVVGHC